MFIPTFLVIICLTWKIHFPRGFTDASFLPPFAWRGMKHKARKLLVPGVEQATGLGFSLPWAALVFPPTQFTDPIAAYCLLSRELTWSFLISARRRLPEFFSSARLSCPDHTHRSVLHTDHSVWVVVLTEALSSPWDPIRHVDVVAFWKELITVLWPAYSVVMGLFWRKAASITESHIMPWVFSPRVIPPLSFQHKAYLLYLHYGIMLKWQLGLIMIMNLAWTRTGLSSLQEASGGLGASLKEQLSLWM